MLILSGAGNRVRTGDLNLGKVALYQLSYSRYTNYHFELEISDETAKVVASLCAN